MNKKERFDHLLAVTSSKRFLGNKTYIQEIPFFICPYLPEEANGMIRDVTNLIKKLKEKNIKVLKLDLYDICLDLLQSKNVLAWIIEHEQEYDKDRIKELLQSCLNIEQFVIPQVKQLLSAEKHDIIFVTGIGQVFPYIRAHNFLSNLQTTIKDKPMLMFFPGDYSHSLEKGSVLELFGRLTDDRYYRAFNIYDIKQTR